MADKVQQIMSLAITKFQRHLKEEKVVKEYINIFLRGSSQKCQVEKQLRKRFEKFSAGLSKPQRYEVNPEIYIDEDDRTNVFRYYPDIKPQKEKTYSRFYRAYLNVIEDILQIIVEKDSNFMGKYFHYVPKKSQKSELKHFVISKGDEDFIYIEKEMKDRECEMLIKLKKGIVYKWLICFSMMIDSLESQDIFHRDLQIRNTIKVGNIFMGIDFQHTIRLPQEKCPFTLEFIESWLELQKTQDNISDVVKGCFKFFFKLERLSQLLQNMNIIQQRFISQTNKDKNVSNLKSLINTRLVEPLLGKQQYEKKPMQSGYWKEFVKYLECKYENIFEKAEEGYEILHRIWKKSHQIQFLAVVTDIIKYVNTSTQLQSYGQYLLDSKKSQQIIQILIDIFRNKNQGQTIYKQFADKLIANIDARKQQSAFDQLHKKKFPNIQPSYCNNHNLLVQYLSKFNLMYSIRIKPIQQQNRNEQALKYAYRNGCRQINHAGDVFKRAGHQDKQNIKNLYYFIQCAINALRQLKNHGIICPFIKFNHFVRDGHKFKISNFLRAFKIGQDCAQQQKGKMSQMSEKQKRLNNLEQQKKSSSYKSKILLAIKRQNSRQKKKQQGIRKEKSLAEAQALESTQKLLQEIHVDDALVVNHHIALAKKPLSLYNNIIYSAVLRMVEQIASKQQMKKFQSQHSKVLIKDFFRLFTAEKTQEQKINCIKKQIQLISKQLKEQSIIVRNKGH